MKHVCVLDGAAFIHIIWNSILRPRERKRRARAARPRGISSALITTRNNCERESSDHAGDALEIASLDRDSVFRESFRFHCSSYICTLCELTLVNATRSRWTFVFRLWSRTNPRARNYVACCRSRAFPFRRSAARDESAEVI